MPFCWFWCAIGYLFKNTLVIQGVVTYVTCWSICDRDHDFWLASVCLVAWSSLQKLLIAWFLWVKDRIGAVDSWSFDCFGSKVTLIPWSALKMGFDCLIQFWKDLGRKVFYVLHLTTPCYWPTLEQKDCFSKQRVVLTFTRGYKNNLATFPEGGGEESVGWKLYM